MAFPKRQLSLLPPPQNPDLQPNFPPAIRAQLELVLVDLLLAVLEARIGEGGDELAQ